MTVAVFPICIELDAIFNVAVDFAALYVSQVLYTGPMFQVPALPLIQPRSWHGVPLTCPSRLLAALQRDAAALSCRLVLAIRGGRKQVRRPWIRFEIRSCSFNVRKYPVSNLFPLQPR
jgi:hypothetical protein